MGVFEMERSARHRGGGRGARPAAVSRWWRRRLGAAIELLGLESKIDHVDGAAPAELPRAQLPGIAAWARRVAGRALKAALTASQWFVSPAARFYDGHRNAASTAGDPR
jgi:hypothetical protein